MLTPFFTRHFIWFDYDTELTSNPSNSQTETSSFVAVARKHCSSQSHWPPVSSIFFSFGKTAVVLSSGTTMFSWFFERITQELTALSPSTMKSRRLLHQEFVRQRRVVMRTNMFQEMVPRMTFELTTFVPSLMRSRWLLHRGLHHCRRCFPFFQPSFNVVSSGGTTMFQEFFFVTEPTLYSPCITVP